MSEMKDMILDVTERILKENVNKDVVDRLEEGKWAEDLWELFTENGITTVTVSEQNGGAGGDLEDLLNIVRLTGKYAAPIPFIETTFANLLLESVSLPPTEGIATYMVSTEEAFTLKNHLITGTVQNIPWAKYANHLVTVANGEEGYQIVLVDLKKAKITPNTNLADEPRDTVIYNEAEIIECSAPIKIEQLEYLTKLETAFRLALISGAIEKINRLTVQYTKEREQFGRPIHRFQLVQQHLVQLAGESAVVQAAFHNFTMALTKGIEQNEVAYARIRVEEAISLVATLSHQVLAAIGTTYEHALQQYTRRLWSWRDEGTNSHYWADYIATQLLENSGDNLWEYLTENKGKVQI